MSGKFSWMSEFTGFPAEFTTEITRVLSVVENPQNTEVLTAEVRLFHVYPETPI